MKGFKEGLLRARESEVAFGGVGSAFSMSKKKHFNFRGKLRLPLKPPRLYILLQNQNSLLQN